jgi:UDP-hydrolysing UDP-N-acetyl-D-glucosamine 2-epimerase
VKQHNTKKKICVAITNRTNYSKLKLVLLELRKDNTIDLNIVASSSILLERYGEPFRDLERDGFGIDKKIDCILMNDSHEAMAKTTGLSMIEHATYFSYVNPDLLLVVGDRFDILGGVVAAAMMNIRVAHIQGGEISGTIDNLVRDIVSKFGWLHFVSTEKSKEKLIRWGLDPSTIYDYGCPAVEYINSIDIGEHFDSRRLKKEFKRVIDIGPDEKYFMVIVHPDTTNADDVDTEVVLRAVDSFGVKAFIFYPNVDANNSRIISSISKYRKNERFYMIRHMPLEGFVHALAHSCCMIGNSSSGIREAASFGVPVINIGDRQNGRERNDNVVDVECNYDELVQKIRHMMERRYDGENVYYREGCSRRIVEQIVQAVNGLQY